jgi:nucleotide-binding universal stress UspA family protein
MKILMAVDGSAYTVKAADFLASHMDWFKGKPELHLLNVRLPLPPGRVQAVLGKEVIEDYYRDEAEAAIEPAERILRAHAIPFDSTFAVGDIAGEIQAHASKWQIDMIVMGSHGHGALKNLVMGSVATKVLAYSSIPVLIVR